MDRMEVMRARHSVRSFTDRQVVPAAAQALRDALDEANREQGLHMQPFPALWPITASFTM